MIKDYISLIRVKHWIKNILIFIPMIFARELTDYNIISTIIGFFSFSFMSSFIYIINDIRDIEKDKLHPRKKNRPLASGKIKKQNALILSIILLLISIILTCYTKNSILNISLYILLSYMILNIGYSLGLKNIAILDIAILASGFVLRVYYGATLIDIPVSNWLFLTILSASLFLGLGKRKKELINSKSSRKVLTEYNENFLDKFQYLTLCLMLVFYSLWTTEQSSNNFIYTIPLVIIIFMKYCLIIEKNDEGDPITVLYSNKFLILLCLIYSIIMFALILL